MTANQSRTLRQQVRHPGLCVNVIAGQPVAAGRRLPVMDPSRNEQIAELAEADAATVSAAVRAAAAAFEQGDWPRTPVDTRAHLLREAGIPDGVVNLVNGSGPVTGAALCTHPRVDRISFTGGTETGRQIMSAAGRLAHPGRGKYRGSFH